jgi:hypothetical protein
MALTSNPDHILTTTVAKRAPQPETLPAVAKMIADIATNVAGVPTASTVNVSETLGSGDLRGLGYFPAQNWAKFGGGALSSRSPEGSGASQGTLVETEVYVIKYLFHNDKLRLVAEARCDRCGASARHIAGLIAARLNRFRRHLALRPQFRRAKNSGDPRRYN